MRRQGTDGAILYPSFSTAGADGIPTHLQLSESRQEARAVPALERVTHVADVAGQDDALALYTIQHNTTGESRGARKG